MFRRAEGGTTAIEFGLLAMPFFLMMFVIMELGMILFTENDFDFKDSYTTLEMKQFLSTIPTHQRQIASRYVYIMKYIDKGNI